jgi:hypothetical protein
MKIIMRSVLLAASALTPGVLAAQDVSSETDDTSVSRNERDCRYRA